MARSPIHPGEILADEIDAREGLTKTELARLIAVPPGRIVRLLLASDPSQRTRHCGSESFWAQSRNSG